jgi:ABC-2 type transport system permease protein
MLAAGVAFGSFADAMLTAAEAMPEAFLELFGGGEAVVAGYLGYMAVFMAYLVGVYAILSVQGLRSEETSGRAEPVLATPVSRVAWLGSHLAVTVAGVIVVLAMAGLGTGVGAAIVTGDAASVWDVTVAHLNQVPAVLVVLGLAALLFGLAPRVIALSWVTVGYALLVGTFGALMDVPDAAFEVSPFEHAATMPVEGFAATPVIVLTVVALAMAALGLAGFRRRDLHGT